VVQCCPGWALRAYAACALVSQRLQQVAIGAVWCNHGLLRHLSFNKCSTLVPHLICRWQAVKPEGGPGGNPSVVLVHLDDAARQLQDLQEEANQLAKVCVGSGWAERSLSSVCVLSVKHADQC
jgi:hypothetical protein